MMPAIILASKSKARQQMLANAGVPVGLSSADLDEKSIIDALLTAGKNFSVIAETLATEKAKAVSDKFEGVPVIGADQLLIFNEKTMMKSNSMEEAKEKLLAMGGQTHQLISGVSVVHDGKTLWSYSEKAHLTFRDFSEADIDAYLADAKEDALSCVGGYAIEGRGIQLFDKIEGDFFTIMGMPLLPLLKFLRQEGYV